VNSVCDQWIDRPILYRPTGVPVESLESFAVRGLDDLSDPVAVEARAAALAALLREFRPSTVLTWETPENVVLGHVVARELGAVSLRCFDDDGLIDVDGVLAENGHVALVVVALDRVERLRAMIALTEQKGRTVGAVGFLSTLAPEAVDELERLGVPLVTTELGRPSNG